MNDLHHQHNNQDPEISEGSVLGSLRKQHVFQQPEGYMAQMRQRMLDMAEDDLLMQEAPLLSSVSKQSIFKIPEGYFEGLHTAWKAKIKPTTGQVAKILPMNGHWASVVWMSAAAAITLFLMVIVPHESTQSDLDWESIDTETLYSSLEEEWTSDADLIYEWVDESALASVSTLDLSDLELTDEELSNLMDEIDLNDLQESISSDEFWQ
ncbi:hypothetical protein [Pontibacter sp. G13]|uniref:hypothetical protein n=1 Tax=Pontibacter sp. G13 TaxID=3074898 RepID=UPI002889D795|nr:hypothetical protein [Pontibacter sp. G13]WNJ19322.1 hypothetical protein RJD25_02420 [Pontibacter sp. G13]